MNFLRNILIKLGLCVQVEKVVEKLVDVKCFQLDKMAVWERSDVREFHNFLTSPLGIKFMSKMQASAIRIAEDSIKTDIGKDYGNAAGKATGFVTACSFICMLGDTLLLSEDDKSHADESLLEKLKA